ncbi:MULTISPECIES: YfjI family protein [unclassified Neptuniibacter]|uniref:YfjI family protein n=1 Tax=unclassified Neptuniibacter TaxID=2630693 RepID=UPI0025E0703F|nr:MULTISPECIES: YfjI family protein [unclassified Neptuniibacter]|tara:strand:+ start:2299 stop:4053 length:1755 start_codon:yes stop_codon:yes gene_type:complete
MKFNKEFDPSVFDIEEIFAAIKTELGPDFLHEVGHEHYNAESQDQASNKNNTDDKHHFDQLQTQKGYDCQRKRTNYGSPPMLTQLQNLMDIDGRQFEHLEMIWEAIKEAAIITQAPGRLIASVIKPVCATVAQGLFVVESPLGSTHPLIINSLIAASSGERKTTVEKLFTRFVSVFVKVVNKIIRKMNQNYSTEIELWNTEKTNLRRKLSKAQKKGDAFEEKTAYQAHLACKPKITPYLTIIHDDFTIDALLQSLNENFPVASIITSEGAKVLDDTNMKSMPFLNKLWDGADIHVTRMSRPSYLLQDARLSTSLMIQPDVLKKIIDKRFVELRNSGYFARAIFTYPNSSIGNRPVFAVNHKTKKLDRLTWRLISMLLELFKALSDPNFERHVLKLDQEAAHIWLQFANDVEQKMSPGGYYQSATDHASKLPENVLRLAAVFHAIEFGTDNISAKTLNLAIHLCLLCSQDFMNCFVPLPQDKQDAQRLYKYLYENMYIPVQNRQAHEIYFEERHVRRNRIRQCGPLKNSERLNQALRILYQQGTIALVEEIRQQGKGKIYIDLLPNFRRPSCTSDGTPLRPLPLF